MGGCSKWESERGKKKEELIVPPNYKANQLETKVELSGSLMMLFIAHR